MKPQSGHFLLILVLTSFLINCHPKSISQTSNALDTVAIKPVLVTEKVPKDSDDPAIWINKAEPSQSLIIGTDKGGNTPVGGLYAFNLQGKIVKSVQPLWRPNNVDVA